MDSQTEETKNEIAKSSNESLEAPQESRHKWSALFLSNWRLKGALILMLLIAGMYGWKNLAVKKVEKETEKQAAKLTETTGQILMEKNRALLRMTAIPLSWVVRMEMPKGNYDNIDQYFKQIIKEDRFKVILLAGTDGKIMVATDRRMEGADLSQYYPASLLEQYETTVSELNSEELIVAAPVIGLTSKLGVLVMVYPMENADQKRIKP
ncbi:MAG: PDC sensor domain-containing protein [Acidobacteria bacterium]|nr:PDC sensor domain-containing protein [Acidobacteriota bacterium]